MSRSEPQITEIAGHFADTLPNQGASRDDAVQAWRHTLRYARSSGAIETLTELIRQDAPEDAKTEQYCDELVG